MALQAYVEAQVFGVLLVFARLGTALMFLPAFGEAQIPARVRLSFALVLGLALYPATPVPAASPGGLAASVGMLAAEVTVGLWIGLTARVLHAALEFAGYQIGQIAGLANALAPGLGSFQGSTMVANLLLTGGIAAIFVTDTHQVMIRALIYSYQVFPVGRLILADMAAQIVKAAGASFYIGVTIAAPFLVMGTILNLGLALANRMMPSLPVFFVAGSVLIGAALLVLAVSLPEMLHGFLLRFADWFGTFTL